MGKTTANSKPSAKPRGKPWPKGVSGNPKGAPRRGESWQDIIKRVGELTPSEASAASLELAKQFLKVGDGVTLKEAVVLRVYGALLFDPQAGLLNAFMDRAEGKVSQPIETWEDRLVAAIRAGTITREEVEREFGNDLATRFFIRVGLPVSESREAVSTGASGSGEADAGDVAD